MFSKIFKFDSKSGLGLELELGLSEQGVFDPFFHNPALEFQKRVESGYFGIGGVACF